MSDDVRYEVTVSICGCGGLIGIFNSLEAADAARREAVVEAVGEEGLLMGLGDATWYIRKIKDSQAQ